MVMYALTVVPLIQQLYAAIPEACQAWFADDATAVGSLSSLFQWWQHLSSRSALATFLMSLKLF